MRQGEAVIDLLLDVRLFPAVRAGLHCGWSTNIRSMPTLRLFSAVRAGLHCGWMLVPTPILAVDPLFPAVRAGLHCGR